MADKYTLSTAVLPRERETSITARIIRTISISMSITELDSLIQTFGRTGDELTPIERTIQQEFINAVEELR